MAEEDALKLEVVADVIQVNECKADNLDVSGVFTQPSTYQEAWLDGDVFFEESNKQTELISMTLGVGTWILLGTMQISNIDYGIQPNIYTVSIGIDTMFKTTYYNKTLPQFATETYQIIRCLVVESGTKTIYLKAKVEWDGEVGFAEGGFYEAYNTVLEAINLFPKKD